jgi:hypothetical protein
LLRLLALRLDLLHVRHGTIGLLGRLGWDSSFCRKISGFRRLDDIPVVDLGSWFRRQQRIVP